MTNTLRIDSIDNQELNSEKLSKGWNSLKEM